MSGRDEVARVAREALRAGLAWGSADPLERLPDFDEEVLMVALPCSWRGAQIVTDSIQQRASCGHLVWIAPNSQGFLRRHPGTIVKCADCATPDIKKELDDRHAG